MDAATKIQRAYKRYRRFKLIGVGTAELDQIHQIDLDNTLTRDNNDIGQVSLNNTMQSLNEFSLSIKQPRISNQKVKKIPIDQINFSDTYNKRADGSEVNLNLRINI